MNERIRALAEQAEQHANEQNDKYGVRFKTEYDQKFAELIVQKCADIGALKADGNYEVYNSIVEYFGMQEPEE